jgi:hypothetical protein
MSHDSDLSRELKRLRRGRGIERPDLIDHVGPELRRRCRLGPVVSTAKARAAVAQLIQDLIRDLPPDLRAAALTAFGLDQNSYFPTLERRIHRFADAQRISVRTARRRVEDATDAMVRVLEEPASAGPQLDPGWRATNLRALFRLDTETPELYEIRRIVATREIREVTVRFSLPQAPGDDNLTVDALFGARVQTVDSQPDNGSWRVVLGLPAVLNPGDELEFWLHVVLPAGRPIWSHYAMVPVDPCESCTVQVRFPPDRLPGDVWLLDGVPYTDLCAEKPAGERIQPSPLGDVRRDFGRLREGYGYGIGWTDRP